MKYLLTIFLSFYIFNFKAEDKIELNRGLDKYQTEAVAKSLKNIIEDLFSLYFNESHFIYGPVCNNENIDCRHNLNFDLNFEAISLDLNQDKTEEVIVKIEGVNACGSGGCSNYILIKKNGEWSFDNRSEFRGSIFLTDEIKNGYLSIFYKGGCGFDNDGNAICNDYKCVYKEEVYQCGILVKKRR